MRTSLGMFGANLQIPVRRKCFISYHHADQAYANVFVDAFDHNHDTFMHRALGIDVESELIDSNNTEYVMRRIRDLYLKDSTVTILLAGRCTWARRYVDWELQASLRQGETVTPNGLLGIKLPTFTYWPERFDNNLIAPGSGKKDCYARWIDWPQTTQDLQNAIGAAFARRATHRNLIVNPRDRMSYNRQCS